MQLILLFALGFALSCLLGITAEVMVPNLYHHAQYVLRDQPLPPITDFVFHHFAGFQIGSILCLFLLPWAILLLVRLLSPRTECPTERHIRLLYRFLFFLMSETFLFLFFAGSSLLPFLPRYGIMQGGVAVPFDAYLPSILLGVVVLGIVGIIVRKYA